MADPEQSLFACASRFFGEMENAAVLAEHLRPIDQVFQFAPSDGQTFHVRISRGRISVQEGKGYPEEAMEVLHLTGTEASFGALFRGDISVAEAIYHHKIQVPDYRNKEPAIVCLSRLLRLGLWACVKGTRVLMPER